MVRHYCKDWLTKDELKKFIDNIDSKEHKLFFKMLYGMALRVSELLTITVKNINLKEGVCKLLDTKTERFEITVIPEWLYSDIFGHILDNNLNDEDPLFKFKNRTYAWELVKKYTKVAKINKEFSTHTFRRSRALHLLNDGVPLEKVSKYLRHKSINTTMHYLKITVEDIKKELNKIGDWYDL
ncbi:phage integrase family protein [Methanococcus vannielii SB]|jgi:integrase|uniref:Phage integrase family protein n=1 Tax=Methanococcus vannielii (strain ATCC 35089 / DSM 1224 / JCM 13029 / OCM 148 / SB) TaxID=406327 RepID=A6USP8_METVS|nr:tyrosine-type recombinase/integrase [Methanococcus vannielii]ABR55520.1 phage integrase family protein [Methanococcus vannielii SB]